MSPVSLAWPRVGCWILALAVGVLGGAGCFDPRTQEGLSCSASGGCPSGQSCVSGTCFRPGNAPGVDAAVDATVISCTTEVLATGQSAATDLDARDSEYVYWTNDGATLVLRSPKQRGPVEVFNDSGAGRHPHGIATDATHVYWSESDAAGRILRKPKDSLETDLPEELALDQGEPTSIALDDTHVYWASRGGNSISRVAKVGGPVEIIALSQIMPGAVAVDATHVFWVSQGAGNVMRSAKDGPPLQQLAGGQGQLSGLSLSADAVFWTAAADDEVRSVDKGGGTTRVVVTGQDGPASIAVGTAALYWSNELAGQVLRLGLDTDETVEVATGQSQPVSLELDGEDLYWLNKLDADNRLVRASCNPL